MNKRGVHKKPIKLHKEIKDLIKILYILLALVIFDLIIVIYFGLIPSALFLLLIVIYFLKSFLNNSFVGQIYECIELMWKITLFLLFLGIITTIIFWYFDDEINEYIGSIVEENFAHVTSYPYYYIVNSTEEDKIRWSLYETNNIVKNNVYYSRVLMKSGIFTLNLRDFNLFLCGRGYGRNLDNIVFLFNCGACYEYSYVFTYLANKVGLNARQVRNPGGDHNWVEVFYKSKWIPIETTRYTNISLGVGTIPTYIYTLKNNKKIELTNKYSSCLTTFIIKCDVCSNESSISVYSLNLNRGRYEGRKIPTHLNLNISENKTFVFTLACGKKTGDYSFHLKDHKKYVYKTIKSLNNKHGINAIKVDSFTIIDTFNYLLDFINKPIIDFLFSLFILFFIFFSYKKLFHELKLLINEIRRP